MGVMHARDAESGARAGAAGSTRDARETGLLQNCANRQPSVTCGQSELRCTESEIHTRFQNLSRKKTNVKTSH